VLLFDGCLGLSPCPSPPGLSAALRHHGGRGVLPDMRDRLVQLGGAFLSS
jgi:hypothetical protein